LSAVLKTSAAELAVLGGRPVFAEPLHVGRPNVGSRERFLKRIEGMLDRSWFTNHGPLVGEFEDRLQSMLDVRHCITLCNATVALEVLMRAAGLTGEVIVPSFTFVATAHAVSWLGLTAVFADVDPATHNVDPRSVERLISPQTTGIIGVHVWGRPCAIDELSALARRHGLRLFFDAAHALGCAHRGRPIGGFGDAEVFSLHATKFLNSFEGGVVATNDERLAEQVRLMSNFGFAGYDNVVALGTNGKMCEASAAMGLTNLETFDALVAVNFRNHCRYVDELSGIPGITVVRYEAADTPNYQYVVLEWDEGITGVSRDFVVRVLFAENVLARRYFFPGCHRAAPYAALNLSLPETEGLSRRVLALPTGLSVSEDAVRQICAILKLLAADGPLVLRALDSDASTRTWSGATGG
jgi:dTDP-4-amino-4,6-dideoxygalactose transaminase